MGDLDVPCIRFIVKMRPEASIVFSDYSGYAVQGFFYNLLSMEDERLATAVHGSRKPAPYSLTPIFDVRSGKPILRYFPADSEGFFSMTVVGDELCRAVTRGMLKRDSIELNGIRCRITDAQVSIIKVDDVWRSAAPVRRFSVDFLTPTKFTAPPRDISALLKINEGRVLLAPHRNIYLPDPERLVVSILNFYGAHFGGLGVDGEERYRMWLAAGGLVCAGYPDGIRTVLLRGHGSSVGFCGKVYYTIPDDYLFSKEYARLTDGLLMLGELFNVGDERTAGLGVIKYVRHEVCS